MSAPATRRVRRIGSDIMFHGHLITKEFLDSIPVGPFTIIPTSPAAMEAHVEAMREAIGFGLCGSKFHWTKGEPYEQLARSALAALMKGRTGAPRRA